MDAHTINGQTTTGHTITSVAALEALYGRASGIAVAKETTFITTEYRAWIEASPFCVLATAGPGGLDATPRGDPAGRFVTVEDERTLLLPDRRGNNRLDSLRNIVADPRVAFCFLLPGLPEAMRVNGRAVISTDPALLDRFAMNGQTPRTVLVTTVESVYFQCAKSIVRSGLWDPARHVPRGAVPSVGALVRALSRDPFDAEGYDRDKDARVAATLY